jgi:uncharacterized repeat protein (TIGR03803 family)
MKLESAMWLCHSWRGRLNLVALLFVVLAAPVRAQTFEELHAFTCVWSDDTGWDCTAEGIGSEGTLVQARDGNFYGGSTGGGHWGGGTIFKMTPAGVFSTIAHFDGTNGASPHGALLQATDGNLYGTTFGGGSWSNGVVFRIAPSGVLTKIDEFTWGAGHALGELVQGADGYLYGVAWKGGDYSSEGIIFRVSTNGGDMGYLHLFYPGSIEGYYPSGGLLLASDGNFYGVTGGGYGTVYKMTPDGLVSLLASFPAGRDGAAWPNGKLIEAPDGSFYGCADSTTHVGAIFRVTKDGALTTVADFRVNYVGQYPVGPLAFGNDGDLYGSCYEGGSGNAYPYGTIFRISPEGAVTLLFSLTGYGGQYSGAYPYAGLVQGWDGNLYGTTDSGGVDGGGNIFRINMPGPLLSMSRYGGKGVLSWRTNFTGYFLECSTDLSHDTWARCTSDAAVIDGRYVVTNSVAEGSRFFRLSRASCPPSRTIETRPGASARPNER